MGCRPGGTARLGSGCAPWSGDEYVVAGETRDASGAAQTNGTGQIAFAPGETSKTLRILINDDFLKELGICSDHLRTLSGKPKRRSHQYWRGSGSNDGNRESG